MFRSNSFSSKLVILFRFLILLCFIYIILCLHKNLIVYITDPLTTNQSNRTTDSIFLSRHHLLINESNNDIRSIYYRHATSARNSSYPFISGDTFRAFADFVFDETRQDSLVSVKYGDIIFVKADMFDHFFGSPYQSINNSFVLVTHNSDFYAPGNHKQRLDDSKILAWYASNPDLRSHPKLYPIPIGLANTRWPSGNLDKLTHAFQTQRKPWAQRTTLLYVNFSPKSNPRQRQAALARAENLTNVQIVRTTISFETYLENVGNAKFVLSPPGNGLDCHRTWEAIMWGAAPVVLSSGLDPLFKEIPAVIINDWANLTENLLLSYDFSSYDKSVPVVLYARYWRDALLKHRSKFSR